MEMQLRLPMSIVNVNVVWNEEAESKGEQQDEWRGGKGREGIGGQGWQGRQGGWMVGEHDL